MRKILVVAIFMTLSFIGYSQDFPKNNVDLLLNKTVKAKEKKNRTDQQIGYENFYTKFDEEKKIYPNPLKNRPFLSNVFNSEYSKLVGKEFKVLRIIPYTEVDKSGVYPDKQKYAIEIENKELGKIFYDYDPEYEFSFELEIVGGVELPEDFYCSEIVSETDKFNGKKTFYTPYESGISFTKTVYKGVTSFYLSVNVASSTYSVGKKGLFVLFEDGVKIKKTYAKVNVDVGNGGDFINSVFVKLTKKEINLFTEKRITDVRVYIHDSAVEEKEGKKIMEYLKCMVK